MRRTNSLLDAAHVTNVRTRVLYFSKAVGDFTKCSSIPDKIWIKIVNLCIGDKHFNVYITIGLNLDPDSS